MVQGLKRNAGKDYSARKMSSKSSIIQCPACQTKFAVRTSQIEEVRSPRFHCSRCDHIFGLDEVPARVEKRSIFTATVDTSAADTIAWNSAQEAESRPFKSAPLVDNHDPEDEEIEDEPDLEEESEEGEEEEEEQESSDSDDYDYPEDLDQEDEKEEEEEDDDTPEDEQEDDRFSREFRPAGDETNSTRRSGREESPEDYSSTSDNKSYRFEDDTEGRAIAEEDRQKEPWRFENPLMQSGRLGGGIRSKREEQITFPFEDNELEVPFFDDEDDEEDEEEAYNASALSWMDKIIPIQEKPKAAVPVEPVSDEDWLSDLISQAQQAPLREERENPKIVRKEEVLVEPPVMKKEAPQPQQTSPASDHDAAPERRRLVREVSSKPRHPAGSPVQTTFTDAPSAEPRRAGRWRTPLLVIFPAAFVVIALLAFSISNPSTMKNFTLSAFPSGPSTPPAGLYITDVQYRQLALENNEEFPAVTGKVVNRTVQTFNEVVVIGGLFDKKGAPIAEVRSNLSSPLHKSRIKALSADMVQKLVSEGSSKTFRLKPGEAASFILPIIPDNTGNKKAALKPPAYFNAKVFSVSE